MMIYVAPKTKDEWEEIFTKWSTEMDRLYDDKERHDATEWSDHPAYWMSPFNDGVYDAWCEYDVQSPGCEWTDFMDKKLYTKPK